MTKQNTPSFFCYLLLFSATVLYCLLIPAVSQVHVNESFNEKYGTHYIVLVDDSGDNVGNSENIQKYLPELIFKGTFGNKISDFPKVRPGKDKISVAFFTIHNDGNPCQGGREYSALPQNMFRYTSASDFKSGAELANYLAKDSCSFRGYASPINTATNLILPFLQKQMKDASLFSQTYIIVASNNAYNANLTSPSEELESLRKNLAVKDTEQAGKIAQDFVNLYRKETRVETQNGLALNISKISSNDLDISPVPEIKLDRAATSSSELRLASSNPGGDSLYIYLKRPGREYDLEPKYLEVSLKDENDAPLQIGGKISNESYRYDLSDCQPPKCARMEDTMVIPLLGAIGEDLKFTPDDLQLVKGKLLFKISSNYQTKLYDRLYVESSGSIPLNPSPKKIPGILFGEKEIENDDLVRYWDKSRDKEGLTSGEAANRILARRRFNTYLFFIISLLLLGFAAILFYRRHSRREFVPDLEWLPSDNIVVDFDNLARSRILVGQLKVINHGEVPWLGRKFGEESQPSATANLLLSYDPLNKHGLETTGQTPIGFIQSRAAGDSEEQELGLNIKKPVTHEDSIFIFLATETIKDFAASGNIDAEAVIPVQFSVEMNWQTPVEAAQNSGIGVIKSWWKSVKRGTVPKQLDAVLTLQPERIRKPVVEFVPSFAFTNDDLHFSGKDGRALVGNFLFRSQAASRFSQPFRGKYDIVGFRENINLGTEIIIPENSEITVLPKEDVSVPVFIICDGEKVLNPAPVYHDYSFNLLGEYDPNASTPGPHNFKLYRDQEKAEIELLVMSYTGEAFEIFWDENSSPRMRRRVNGELKEESEVESGELILPAREIRFDPGSLFKQYLCKLEIGNSAKFGEGSVSVQITANAEVSPKVRAGIERSADFNDFVGILLPGDDTFQKEPAQILIKEGQISESREIKFTPEWIEMIQGAKVESEDFHAKISLDITIRHDTGTSVRRHLDIRIPIYLEQLAGRNWLCIDFGTSAIAVAHGSSGKVYSLNLQEVSENGDPSLAKYDSNNSESENVKLIPSQIICDADVRVNDSRVKRQGFPHSPGDEESLRPGHPNFVGLPAFSNDPVKISNRVIYSLKSWLGRSAGRIHFSGDTKIKYLDERGKLIEKNFVPLDEVVKSAFSALYTAYLFDKENQAGQIVITHPNSFTEIHKQRLHNIAFDALAGVGRFEIPLKERFKLISESDAVAYHYCNEKRLRQAPSGNELILVYDFGAGTLDLSLIEVHWRKSNSGTPEKWIVKSRLGIPVAGNHIDQILARLIDKHLRSDELKQQFTYQYKYQVVSERSGDKLNDNDHRTAIIELWREIRKGKHRWKGSGTLEVKVGEISNDRGIIRDLKYDNLPTEPEPHIVSLFKRDREVYISITDYEVHHFRLMVEFIDFVTEDMIDEILTAADVSADDVTAVIVSGRGALWPGLREKIKSRFQNAEHSNFKDMKQVVAEGAIAWQELDVEPLDKAREKMTLGILINNDNTLIPIEDEYKELNLEASSYFRVVQVALKNPQPLIDMGTLREYFYNDLFPPINRIEIGWRRNERFYVKKEIIKDKLVIKFKGEHTENVVNINDQVQTSEKAVEVPWPSGYNFLLPPED